MTQPSVAQRMMSLFEGFAGAYGTYDRTDANPAKGGKLEIKGTARTLREPVTVALWEAHLTGERSLGIIPIRDNDTCLWGVIDVDDYASTHADIVKNVKEHGLPLVCCRSKSGGAHLFVFLKDPLPASVLQVKLREMAALLGYGNSEVFPKQTAVLLDRGDLGSWLNMPYFGGDKTERYAVKENGSAMTLSEFLAAAEGCRVTPERLGGANYRKEPKDPELGDGPPCLQHMAAAGFPEGMRNKGLFALGVFAKRKYGHRWKEVVEDFNRKFLVPPLPSSEVVEIIRSLEKKDYQYSCSEFPLSAHCNSVVCRTRAYGVGGDDDYPVISGLSVLDTDPPLWFLDVEGQRLELTTDDLQNYKAFHKACMEKMFICYRMMKQDTWLSMVAHAMKNSVRIEAPKEVGIEGHFEELLEDFVLNRHRAEHEDEILAGRPWYCEKEDKHFFRLRDLMQFLETAKFTKLSRSQIVTRIERMGGGKRFKNLKGKGVNTFYVPAKFIPMPTLDLPPLEGDPV